jgi:hypothetical protein
MKSVLILICSLLTGAARGAMTWDSPTTGTKLEAELMTPTRPARNADGTIPAVVYLKNLSIPRIGTEPDNAILGSLTDQGMLVLVLDYAHHPKAAAPQLDADILKLRDDVAGKNHALLSDQKIDPAHLFFLVEGFTLKRDLEFARDGDRVLAMDIAYPSKPDHPAPTLMEITCDNQNRMGSSSLLFCHDALLEVGQMEGFATAMVDHPVPPPYKGLDDPMPGCIDRLQRAVKTLRGFAEQEKLSPNIGAIGFSRGAPMAAILAVLSKPNDPAAIQAALIHGNRYDYLNLLATDPMLPRFTKAWGELESNRTVWAKHGAAYYLDKTAAPMFLNTSDKESPEYQDGLAKFDKLLTDRGIEHEYQVDANGRGHRVSTDPKTLAAIYGFFHDHLDR